MNTLPNVWEPGSDQQGRTLEAQECLDRGVIFALYGERDTAIGFYGKALQIDDGNALAHYVLGVALMDRGERQAAHAEWRRALDCGRSGSQQDWARRQSRRLLDLEGTG